MRKVFLEDYANMTGEGLPLSQEDVFQLSEKVDKAEDWLNEQLEAQKEKKPYEEAAFKTLDVNVKENVLYKAGDVLVKKVKYWKPPKPTVAPKNETVTEEGAAGEEGEEEVKAEDGEEVKEDEKKEEEPTPENAEQEQKAEDAEEAETSDDSSEQTTPEPSAEPSTHDPTDL